ncbi:MAG: phosphoglycerate dehydrogenase [Desulfobacca sp. 4484_104]|nr:MAG: phosphoglycerate dehydrogenase [Desulfobacca sp. 4484_104]RLA90401.1 MAG: phosphoglycerate dehydrogenase [Deltaproteobacteria bacterium]
MKVLISDDLHPAGIAVLENTPNIEVVVQVGMDPAELMEAIQDVEGLIIRSATKVTDKVIEASNRLKVVGRAGTGLDNVDIGAATKRGIVVMNTPGGNSITTAEHAISLLLALARNIPQAAHSMREGRWEKKRFQGRELYNKTLGIIGLGRIGTIVASRAQGLKMRILGYDPYVKREMVTSCGVEMVSLDDLLARSDFITLHTPKTKDTAHILNRKAFRKMKPGVMVVNCARGGLIDEAALVDALQEGIVAGAAIDVFEQEPPVGSPLLIMGNVICTPHLGASTEEAQKNVAVAIAEQVADYLLTGTIKNAVNAPAVSGEMLAQARPYLTLAEALGSFQAQIIEGPIDSVAIDYIGEVSKLETKPLTHSLLKGLLYPVMHDEVNYINAPSIAKSRGIHLTEAKIESAEDFTTLIRLSVRSGTQQYSVAGTIFGKYEPRLVRINEFRLEALPEGHLLFIYNTDRPGVIGSIGTTIGKHNINIARMQVGQEKERGQNVILLTTDTPITPECLEDVRRLPHVAKAMQLEL